MQLPFPIRGGFGRRVPDKFPATGAARSRRRGCAGGLLDRCLRIVGSRGRGRRNYRGSSTGKKCIGRARAAGGLAANTAAVIAPPRTGGSSGSGRVERGGRRRRPHALAERFSHLLHGAIHLRLPAGHLALLGAGGAAAVGVGGRCRVECRSRGRRRRRGCRRGRRRAGRVLCRDHLCKCAVAVPILASLREQWNCQGEQERDNRQRADLHGRKNARVATGGRQRESRPRTDWPEFRQHFAGKKSRKRSRARRPG